MEVRTKTIDQGLYGMDNIIIPKAIMYEDIYEESKIMFGSLFTEAVNNFADKIESNGKNTVIEQIEDRMRDRIMCMSDSRIMVESCCYSVVKVRSIRKEVMELIGKIDISVCID